MIHKTFPVIYLKQKEVLRWTFPIVFSDRKQFSVVPALQLPSQVEKDRQFEADPFSIV